jgi:hypothetical protein
MSQQEVKVKVTAEDATQSGLDKALGSVKSFADSAKTAVQGFIAAFAIERVAEFFSSAVSKAMEAEKAFIQVGNALKNIGINANTVRPQVDALIRSLSDKTGFKTEDIEAAFAVVLRRTGDYTKAQQELGEVLDVMAAKNIDAASAANLVAKAHEGAAKAIAQVKNTQGAAEAQNTSYIKTLNLIRNAWNDVLIKLGDAILKGDGVTSSGNKLVDMLKSVSTWIETHQKDIADFRDGILSVASAFGTLAGSVKTAWDAIKNSPIYQYLDKGARELEDNQNKYWKTHDTFGNVTTTNPVNKSDLTSTGGAGGTFGDAPPPKKVHNIGDDAKDAKTIEQQVADYKELQELHEIDAKTWGAIIALQAELGEKLQKANLPLHERVELLKQVDELEKISADRLKQFNNANTALQPGVIDRGGSIQGQHEITGIDISKDKALQSTGNVPSLFDTEQLDHIKETQAAIESMSGAFLSLFENIGKGANVFQTFAQYAKKALADLAASEAKHFLGLAAGNAAKGLEAAADPLTAAAAPGFFAAAAEDVVAAGLLGALGGAISGGGASSGGGSTSQSSLNNNANAVNSGTTSTIIIQGGILDMSDPRQASALATAIGDLTSQRIIVQQG